MPIYEYKCGNCDSVFEKMQKISDEPLTICEKCGGNVEKQWSLSGFQFKGAGWYVTDYSGKKGDTTSEKSSAKKSSSESTEIKESASKDTKPVETKSTPDAKGDSTN